MNDVKDECIKLGEIPAASECRHNNVVLLALSSISGLKNGEATIRRNTYKYQNNTFDGWYQLEVIPKFIAYKLKEQNECITEVIMLSSSATKYDHVGRVVFEDADFTPMDNATAEKVFIDRMKDVIRPCEIASDDFFTSILVDENRSAQGLKDLADTIRSKYQDVKDCTNFYLVTNGGLRGIQRMQEAVVMLLKNENYHIEAAYGMEFDQKGKNSKIIDETKRLEIFEFVAGMNEFLDTGKNNSLERYLGKNNPVTKAMGQVADGIQWGDVTGFEKGLKNIRAALKENDNNLTGSNEAVSEEKTYLNIFKENIKLDYGKLIQDHDTVDEIEWCMKKNFYQQALALVEAKMSSDIFKWGILRVVNENYNAPIYNNDYFNGMITSNNYSFERLTREIDADKENHVFEFDEWLEKEKEGFEEIQTISRKFSCEFNHNQVKKSVEYPFEYGKFLEEDSLLADKIYLFFAIHRYLKRVRNDMMHLNPVFRNKNVIKYNLSEYIKLAKEIRDSIENMDASSKNFIKSCIKIK